MVKVMRLYTKRQLKSRDLQRIAHLIFYNFSHFDNDLSKNSQYTQSCQQRVAQYVWADSMTYLRMIQIIIPV